MRIERLPRDGAGFTCGHRDHMVWDGSYHAHDGEPAVGGVDLKSYESLRKNSPRTYTGRALCAMHIAEARQILGE